LYPLTEPLDVVLRGEAQSRDLPADLGRDELGYPPAVLAAPLDEIGCHTPDLTRIDGAARREPARDALGAFSGDLAEALSRLQVPLDGVPHGFRTSGRERVPKASSGILRDVATQEDVDRTLRKLVKRLDGADIDGADLPEEARSILCSITDLDLDYRADYSKGRIRKLRLVEDGSAQADVKISVSSDELIALANGKSSLPMALLFGRIRVNANARDLLLLRQLF
jgi:hypothetical protein